MSTYPGENPQTPEQPADGEPQDTPEGTEPTQPVGYWERQAAEQGREQVPPTTPYPQQGQNPYGQIPGVNPYGPYAPGGQQQTGAPYSGQPYTGQPPQPPLPGQAASYGPGASPYSAYVPVPPPHPQATTAMVLGLVGLVGALFTCGLTLVVSPFAWVVGHGALRDIKASQGRQGGESNARAGMVMGIVGTVFLILAIIAVIGFIALVALTEGTGTSTGSTV